MQGRFFVIDGVDGCGKSTQAVRLVDELRRRGRNPLHLREPGSTGLGEGLRALLLDPSQTIGPAAETLLFAAARRQMLDELVRPALAAGRDVVCERFHPSTYAYQAVAGGLDEDAVLRLLDDWTGDPRPDRILLLDVDPHEAAGRRGAATDRIEAHGVDFQHRVAEGFRRYAGRDGTVVVVSGSGDADAVAGRVLAEVERAG